MGEIQGQALVIDINNVGKLEVVAAAVAQCLAPSCNDEPLALLT